MPNEMVRWGVLGAAKIAREKVIPGIQKSSNGRVTAIASRDFDRAKATAGALGIEKAYGSYEELLQDKDIDAVYVPLPNDLHVEWSVKALAAGKHVLCEKPIGMDSAQALELLEASRGYPGLKLMEAFMYRFHPQWRKVRSIIADGTIGRVKTIHSFFSYYNVDPQNIRNKTEAGGGALMDIGCYCVSFPRFLFGEEPLRAVSSVDRDPATGTDRLTSALLEFPGGRTSTFTCSTQLMPYQRALIFGDEGLIEIEIPVNAPADAQSRVWVRAKKGAEEIIIEPVDQYTIQAEMFSRAILEDTAVPTDLQDAVDNMKAIEAIFRSAERNGWETLG